MIRNIHVDQVRQSIMKNCLKLFDDLNIQPLAEGVESHAEFAWLKAAGVELMQGYYLQSPALRAYQVSILSSAKREL